LITYVTIASFIDASVLFAAFIAGGIVSFLWGVQGEQLEDDTSPDDGSSKMYDEYYKAPMDYILVPFFFVSSPFSIHRGSENPSLSEPILDNFLHCYQAKYCNTNESLG
jgi:nitrogen fixation-related uncharacterized protein